MNPTLKHTALLIFLALGFTATAQEKKLSLCNSRKPIGMTISSTQDVLTEPS